MNDLKTFEKAYILHWEKLYAFCFRMTRDEHLSQNMVQDIFADLWERRHELNILLVENYLYRAAKNQVLKEYRKKSFETVIIDEKFEVYQLENSAPDQELLHKLYGLLENLPERRKEILIMSKLDQMDIDQIALKLNISRQTVKNQISMALKQLRLDAGEMPAYLIFLIFYNLIHLNNSLIIT